MAFTVIVSHVLKEAKICYHGLIKDSSIEFK